MSINKLIEQHETTLAIYQIEAIIVSNCNDIKVQMIYDDSSLSKDEKIQALKAIGEEEIFERIKLMGHRFSFEWMGCKIY